LNIIVLDVPRHDVTDVSSSSYDLSFFSSKVGSAPEENTRSLIVSVGELWPEIDLLDEVVHGGTSAVPVQGPLGDQISCSCANLQGSRKRDEGSSYVE
jgi:hypothetical protein